MLKFLSILLSFPALIFAQRDSLQNVEAKKIKKGLSLGVIPVLSYDADLGYRYGGVLNIFDYGKGEKYPDYEQYLFLRFTNSTKGTSQTQLLFDSERIIPKAKLLFETSYLTDKLFDFFGFNGRSAIFMNEYIDPRNSSYINKYFYAYDRKLLRVRLDIQKYIVGRKLRLLAGYTFNDFKISAINHQKLDIPKGENCQLDTVSLYEYYNHWGVIKSNEKNGGTINYLTLGFIYDTRNSQCYCTNGKWFETMLIAAPGGLNKQPFSKIIATYRQYHDFLKNKLTLTYRISSQTKLSGDIPFYTLPVYFDSRMNQDGIGGAFNLRGVVRNRVVANGYLVGNLEIRAVIKKFKLFKQEFTSSFAVCTDMAYITQEYTVNTANVPIAYREKLFMETNQKLSTGVGPGLYFVFNKNNIITVNYGVPLNKSDGAGGLYIGSSLLF